MIRSACDIEQRATSKGTLAQRADGNALMSLKSELVKVATALKKLEAIAEEARSIDAVTQDDDEWEMVTATADSGAANTVGPKTLCEAIPIKPTEASIAGDGSHFLRRHTN